MNKNEEYSFDDLVSDESFQNWVAGKATTEEETYWNSWVKAHPEQKPIVDEAASLLNKFDQLSETEEQLRVEQSWKELRARIEKNRTVVERPARVVPMGRRAWLKYAAAIALLFVSLFAVYQYLDQPAEWITYTSDFGEKKSITLPDGTEVMLNANSQLKVKSEDEFDRHVLLASGEAFFKVTKTSAKEQFVVTTKNFDVQVLGTEFNVNLRGNDSEVMLREGKINLQLKGGEEALMQPGQLARLSADGGFNINAVTTSNYDAWLNNKIVFENTTLLEIGALIETHYGVKVALDSSLHNKKLSGEIPNDNLELLLNALEVTHDLDIRDENNTIKISE